MPAPQLLTQVSDCLRTAREPTVRQLPPPSPQRQRAEQQQAQLQQSWQVWRSPAMPVAKVASLQRFELGAICAGGFLRVDLLGRTQRQAVDDLFYSELGGGGWAGLPGWGAGAVRDRWARPVLMCGLARSLRSLPGLPARGGHAAAGLHSAGAAGRARRLRARGGGPR